MDNERIWAPWRLSYITGSESPPQPLKRGDMLPGGEEGCFLCEDAVADDHRHRLVIDQGEYTVTVLNRYPYNNGHLLVAPRRHVARLDQLDACEQPELFETLTRMVGLLERTLKPEGFNVGLNLGRAAGAGLPGHLHWHIVPRWNGDTNLMPVLAGIRVIPQSLDALWEGLTGALAASAKDA